MKQPKTSNQEIRRVAPDPAKRGEFDLIADLFAPLTDGDERALGLLDDAAVLPQITGIETVVTTDTLVAGVHFLMAEAPDVIARRLLRVNLSDIAAMGAQPSGYFLNLSLPADIGNDWLVEFVSGLAADQQQFGFSLLGGDTTRTPGPLVLSVNMLGEVPAGSAIRRSSAKAGDVIFVSGTIGDAGLGLARLRDGAGGEDPLIRRYQLPEPRVSLGNALRGIASAMADVSDGLLADLGHICEASTLGATVDAAAVPLSEAASSVTGPGDADILALLTSGDDYELVFTVPPDRIDDVHMASSATDTPVTEIGRMGGARPKVNVKSADGRDISPERTGYRHF